MRPVRLAQAATVAVVLTVLVAWLSRLPLHFDSEHDALVRLSWRIDGITVEEWDVASSETPPVIDPPPVRTIHVILRPNQPPQMPMGQPPQQAPFDESHMRTVVNQMGENVRAVFLAGWEPMGPGLFPAPYPYARYLEETWGVDVDAEVLILEAIGTGPGRMNPLESVSSQLNRSASSPLAR